MEVSSQRHAPAALLPRKKKTGSLLIGGWVGAWNGLKDLEKRKMCFLAGIWTSGNPVHRLVSILTKSVQCNGSLQVKWSEIQSRVYEIVNVPRDSWISMLDVQWMLGYVLGTLCASSVYCVFIAVALCVLYQFLLEAGLLAFV